ncbi:DEAD/DEAH box helicase family protein [Metabacillus fastidiosus]|uniref:DEAD/DEAH box helicase family protein n=1 Tax=Metabacillus fastidiosus TaxID=1458 RepID=UPI003D2A0439
MENTRDKKELIKVGESLLSLFKDIHGDDAVEIRFIPENRDNKVSISIIKEGDCLYTSNDKGELVKVIEEMTPESFIKYIEECYRFAGHTAACFTPNSPNFQLMKSCKTTNADVINGGNINCQFVDIDAPKEIRHDNGLIKSWKQSMKEKILSFSLRPSIVVETKNGYHVYWLLKNGVHKWFRHIQMQLVKHFDGDQNCINEARLLRLPHFLHLKDRNNPFVVKFQIKEPQNKYTQEELMNVLPFLEQEVQQKVLRDHYKDSPIEITEGRRANILDLLINEIYSNIVKEDEKKITLHCCMPNHVDRRPSAWFDKDYMYYHCAGCRVHYSLFDLARELGWKYIMDVWNKYDVDIDSEINKIKEQMVNVQDLPHLALTSAEYERVNKIVSDVNDELHQYGQEINLKHQKYIFNIVQTLYKANKDKPYLIPLDMGGGKSLIINLFLQKNLESNREFGAVVVVERIEDVRRLANELNLAASEEVAYPLYGFDSDECLLNKQKGRNFDHCPASKGKSCSFKHQCRYWMQAEDQQKYPVVIMTSQRLSLQSENLKHYDVFYNKNGDKVERELLIIDEKPKMTYVKSLNGQEFKDYTDEILNKLESFHFDGELKEYYEFKGVVESVNLLYEADEEGIRETFDHLNSNFSFSEEFWRVFNSIYDYTQEVFQIPNFLESIVQNGGCKEVLRTGKVIITTSSYKQYKCFKNFKTMIFDGTADIDIEYSHEKFHIFNFESLRSYEGLTFFRSDLVSGTKTSMKDEDKLLSFCKDVISIAKENLHDKIYLPVFKGNKEFVIDYLKEYIDSGQIIVAHYGATRGSNAYKECSIVILGGILHKTENYYLGKSLALHQQRDIDIKNVTSSNYDKVRRFDDPQNEIVKLLDMLVDYSQEIKRSKQRDNSKVVEGKVYIFHHDKILLDLISLKFPKSKMEKWIPQNMLETSIRRKRNNKNVKLICEYITINSSRDEISFEEIKDAIAMTNKQQFSNLVNRNKEVKAIITVHGYEVKTHETDRRKKKLVKV